MLFQLPQPLREQRTRYQRHTPMNVVKIVGAVHQLAQNQRRPSGGEDFRGLRDRTELAIATFHKQAFNHCCSGCASSEIRLASSLSAAHMRPERLPCDARAACACLETTDDVAGVGLIVDLDKTARFH